MFTTSRMPYEFPLQFLFVTTFMLSYLSGYAATISVGNGKCGQRSFQSCHEKIPSTHHASAREGIIKQSSYHYPFKSAEIASTVFSLHLLSLLSFSTLSLQPHSLSSSSSLTFSSFPCNSHPPTSISPDHSCNIAQAKYSRPHILETETFASVFGPKATRKRPNIQGLDDLGQLRDVAETKVDSYSEENDRDIVRDDQGVRDEKGDHMVSEIRSSGINVVCVLADLACNG